MNQRFIYSDKADLYLKDKLSGKELVDFEETMRQDPLLQSEMKLQKEVYQALAETRKAGLKARLNQIPIDQSPWFVGTAFRMTAIVSALVVTSVATYVTLNPSESENVVKIDVAPEEQLAASQSILPLASPKPAVSATEKTVTNEIVNRKTEASLPSTRPAETKKATSREIPQIQRPAVASDFSENDVQLDYSDFELPQKQALQSNTSMRSDISVEKVVDPAYQFHYQFYNGKLFLYGNFQDSPYKIIALNTEEERSLFLEYASQYYRIVEQEEVLPLTSITDTSLVKELRRLSVTD